MSDLISELPIVSSLIVQMRPEIRKSIEQYITQHSNAEIGGSDSQTKLVVVVEMESDTTLTQFINELNSLSGVLCVSMVFHHNDSDSNVVE